MFVVNYYAYRYVPFGRKKKVVTLITGPPERYLAAYRQFWITGESIEVMAVMRHPIRGSGFLLQSARRRKLKTLQQANPAMQSSYLPRYHLSIAGRNRYRSDSRLEDG